MKITLLILMVCFLWWNAENTTDIRQNVKFTSVRQNGGKRRSTGPILLYHNHVATFQLLLSEDIETNPGPVTCTLCQKTVRRNSLQFRCTTCKDSTHVKCIKKNISSIHTAKKITEWTRHRCLCSELPFHCTRNIDDTISLQEDFEKQTPDNQHLDTLNANRSRISISHEHSVNNIIIC